MWFVNYTIYRDCLNEFEMHAILVVFCKLIMTLPCRRAVGCVCFRLNMCLLLSRLTSLVPTSSVVFVVKYVVHCVDKEINSLYPTGTHLTLIAWKAT